MKPGNSLRAVAMLGFATLAISFQTLYAQQVDTIPRKDTIRRDTMSSARPAMTYIDLNTGNPVDIYYDTVRYVTMNRVSRAPVDYYVINNVDTVQGTTGLIVNNMLIKQPNGKYLLDPNKVRVMGDEIRIMAPEGRRAYWTPEGLQIRDWGTTPAMQGEVKQKGNEKKGKMKDQWGTIKWKKGEWKYESNKGM